MTNEERTQALRLAEKLTKSAGEHHNSLLLSIALEYKGADGRTDYIRDVLALAKVVTEAARQ